MTKILGAKILGFLILALAIQASAAPIFPPLISGQYEVRARTAVVEYDVNGVPTTPPTASVGLRRVDLPDAPLLICADAGPGELVVLRVTVGASGDRAELRGVAFNQPGCQSFESDRSENGAYIFFVPPAPPALEPATASP